MNIQSIIDQQSNYTQDKVILLAHILNKDKSFIYAHPEYQLSLSEKRQFDDYYSKIIDEIPLAYIVREKEFYSRRFYIDRRVLIPRPETEAIVDQSVNQLKDRKEPISVLEVGVGSGTLLISIILELKKRGIKPINIIGADISQEALTVAKMNLRRYHLQHQVRLIQSDLFKKIPKYKFDLILANLPYLPSVESRLNKYEPQIALDGGVNGNELLQKFISQIEEFRKPNGIVVIEKYNGDIEIL